jgi:hypothetical protein
LEKLRDLQYKTWTPMSEDTLKVYHDGSGPCENRIEAAVEVLSWIGSHALGFSQKTALKRKLDELYPKIRDKIQKHTGVLVVVQYQKWKYANPSNNPPQLLSVSVGPAASNGQSAFRKWRQIEMGPTLKQGPKDGMIYGPIQLLWLTRITPDTGLKDQKDQNKETTYWKSAP